ncbi:hypothetical protein EDB85DRAFT_1895347 [Lactarius pseudohatsudake]|nr:hypothetical protein EDB85DRAFT_1895347 [Lactarius pseudohatsudake]
MNRDHHLNNDTSARDQNMMEGTLADDEGEDTNPDVLRMCTQRVPVSQHLRGVQSDAVPSLATVKPRVVATLNSRPISEHDRTPRTKKRPCPDTPGRTSLGEKQKQLFDEILTTPRAALINRHPGIGWAALSSHASSSSQDECCSQEESAIVHTASKGKQKEMRNYTNQLKKTENIELDGQGDGVANESPEQPRSPGPSQRLFSHSTAPISHLPSSRVSHPPLRVSLALPRNLDRAGQYQGELGGYSGTNDVQQGSQAYIIGLLEHCQEH